MRRYDIEGSRRLRQIAHIRVNADMNELELAKKLLEMGVFSKKTSLFAVRCSIARERRRKQLIQEGWIRNKPKDFDAELAEIARADPPPGSSPKLAKLKKQSALDAISAYLLECLWKLKHTERISGISFWKDPHSGSIHRVDMAFLVAMTRESELRRLSKKLPKSMRDPD